MEMENVPDLLNGSTGDLDVLSSSPDVDKLLMKKPALPGDSTDRIKRRVRRQSSREGTAATGGGCTFLTAYHHHHSNHHLRNGHSTHTTTAAAKSALTAGAINVVPGLSYFAPQRRWKNSRRSRNHPHHHHHPHANGSGDSRGLPKKGGAGGKGVWGLLGSELLVEEDVCDAQDPNYDSEANDAANTELLELIAEPTPDEFYKLCEPLLLEYYENGDTEEAIRSLREVMQASGALRVPHYIVACAVEMSMNHKDSHREMTSLLISELYGRMLWPEDIERGFRMLLARLDDLVLDTPEAPQWLGNFVARAVADDCIAPRFVFGGAGEAMAALEAEQEEDGLGANGGDLLDEEEDDEAEEEAAASAAAAAAAAVENGHNHRKYAAQSSRSSSGSGGSGNGSGSAGRGSNEQLVRIALKRADSLLSLKTTMVHLDNIWGSAGPLRPVKNINKRMMWLLKEFVDSRDVAEAQRCLRALEVPHYHHELVYEAVVMVMEAVGGGQVEERMCELLLEMDRACLVSSKMMEQGFQRVYDDMTDIVLDVPLAYIMLDRFVERCQRAGFLTETIVNNMPSRGRKRFVSEGDGGQFKSANGRLLY